MFMFNKVFTFYVLGSVYKVVMVMVGLYIGTISDSDEVNCFGYYEFGGRRFRCYNCNGYGSLDLVHVMSCLCDIYFYRLGE